MIGQFEENLLSKEPGLSIIGVDEVGRGCIAGPVYAGCASINYNKLKNLDKKDLSLIRDSKTLSHKQRAHILTILKNHVLDLHIGVASVFEIETKGIIPATFLAMKRALLKCKYKYNLLLVDGNRTISDYPGKQKAVIRGDSLCYSIAAASIVAKESRDSFMRKTAATYPEYGFETHVGYGTKKHVEMIYKHGPCPLHRKTFAPISKII